MKKRTDAIINIILVSMALIILNIVASSYFLRLDFTKGKMYTISDSTKNIIKGLKSPLILKFYVSEEMPPRVQPIKRDILDILKEYEYYSNGNVKLSVLVPEKDKTIEEDAKKAGIEKVNLNVIGKDKEEVQAIFMGVSVYFQEKSETMPVVMSVKDLEYELTSNILKLTREKKDKIVFLNKEVKLPDNLDPQMKMQLMQQMPPSHSIKKDTQIMGQALSEQYDVEEIQLQEGQRFPENTKIVIIHEADNLSEWEKFVIDQFIITGGKAIFLQSGMKLGQGMTGQERRINYSHMFESYGLKLQNNFVFDLYNFPAMIPSGSTRYLSPFPLWVKVGKKQLSADLPDAVKETGALGFSFTSSIDIDKKEGLTYKTIASSSGKSWAESGTIVINLEDMKMPDESQMKMFNLAVLAEGKFPSAFTKDKLPPAAGGNLIEKGTADGAVLLIGTPEFILDRNIKMFQPNAMFFTNIIDHLTNSSELVGIRSRSQGYDFIDSAITDPMKTGIRWFGTLFIPILIIIYGISRMMIRNRRSGRAS